MKKSLIAVALIAASFAAPASQFFTGNDLLQRLTSDDGRRALAVGYVLGVADSNEGANSCTPDGVVSGQLADVVQTFLATNPKSRHVHADVIVAFALKQAWPCKAPAAKPSKSSSV